MHRQSALNQKSFSVRLPSTERIEVPLVLFVCVHNAGRSRMAEAFFNDLAKGRYEGRSAGTEPAPAPHPEVVESMRDVGVELDPSPGRLLSEEEAGRAELVIGMGCSVADACPTLQVPLEDWALDDPHGKSPEDVAAIRDDIEMKVRNLIARLDRERDGRP